MFEEEHVIHFRPGLPWPYKVRIPRSGKPLSYVEREDYVGYGKSADEALSKALSLRKAKEAVLT